MFKNTRLLFFIVDNGTVSVFQSPQEEYLSSRLFYTSVPAVYRYNYPKRKPYYPAKQTSRYMPIYLPLPKYTFASPLPEPESTIPVLGANSNLYDTRNTRFSHPRSFLPLSIEPRQRHPFH